MINAEGERAPVADPLAPAALDRIWPSASPALAWVCEAQRGKRGALQAQKTANAPIAVRPARNGAPLPPERSTFEPDPSDSLDGEPAAEEQGAVLIKEALGALGIAAFICDGFALVRALTPVAESALASGRIRLVNGRLSPPQHYDAAEMEAAIAAATSFDLVATEPSAQTIVNRDPRQPASVQVIDVITLPRQPSPFSSEPRAIVVLRGSDQNRAELEPILTRAFGLTPAEAQVAARLASGQPREMIAAERGASLQTVRSQIKSIFAKLNVTRERELVSMLARITQR